MLFDNLIFMSRWPSDSGNSLQNCLQAFNSLTALQSNVDNLKEMIIIVNNISSITNNDRFSTGYRLTWLWHHIWDVEKSRFKSGCPENFNARFV